MVPNFSYLIVFLLLQQMARKFLINWLIGKCLKLWTRKKYFNSSVPSGRLNEFTPQRICFEAKNDQNYHLDEII